MDYGRLVTLFRSGLGVVGEDVTYVCFVDVDLNKDIVKRVPLEPTRGQPLSKARFVHCQGSRVYSTDLGLGLLYITGKRDTVKSRVLFL